VPNSSKAPPNWAGTTCSTALQTAVGQSILGAFRCGVNIRPGEPVAEDEDVDVGRDGAGGLPTPAEGRQPQSSAQYRSFPAPTSCAARPFVAKIKLDEWL
jgi:hypothetical protein